MYLQAIDTFAQSGIYTKETQYKDTEHLHQTICSWFSNWSSQKCYWKPEKNLELDCELQALSQHEAWQMLHPFVRNRSMVL